MGNVTLLESLYLVCFVVGCGELWDFGGIDGKNCRAPAGELRDWAGLEWANHPYMACADIFYIPSWIRVGTTDSFF
jgi:hypothetical protein